MSTLSVIAKISKCLPLAIKKTLYLSLVQPHLDYCCVVWSECNKSDSLKLDRIHRDVLPSLIKDWSPEDIYNCDETGLYYRALPDGTYTRRGEKVSGGKKSKNRLTILLCCNSEGSHLLPPLVIGTSKNPRCFKNVQHLPLPYEANPSAWMTSELFCKWLIEVDSEMKKKKRNILLFADNAPCHAVGKLPRLSNVKIEFLPPNTTSKVQPLDQGIIRAIKQHYRKCLLSNLVAKLVSDSEKPIADFVKTTTVLDALHYLKQAWQKVKPTCVQNCFRKAGFTLGSLIHPNPEENHGATVFNCSPMDINEEEFDQYVSMDSDIDCYGDLTDEQIAQEVQGVAGEDLTDEEPEDQELPVPTATDTIQALQTVRCFLDAKGLVQALNDFYPVEDQICKVIASSSRHQTLLDDFFHLS